ncbi:hypothetical protein CEXT_715581 [Caerostris extrusa]|uniref:Uncharacterized protein n=1 Tax=Caerostris extrusa TaxID=172846 RepID=A0AAV4M780_CAEEX|nr:hypothetical protein CEXT_715581 [Caerostris extrusa]
MNGLVKKKKKKKVYGTMGTLPRRKTKSSTNNPEEKRKENQTRRSDGHTSRHRFSKSQQSAEHSLKHTTHKFGKEPAAAQTETTTRMNGLVKSKKKKKSMVPWALFLAERQKFPQTTPRKRGRKIKQDARMGTLPDIGFPKGKSTISSRNKSVIYQGISG